MCSNCLSGSILLHGFVNVPCVSLISSLPEPTVPSLPGVSVYSVDAVIIAIVAFSQCVSLAALMAKKHNYTYDANQVLRFIYFVKI